MSPDMNKGVIMKLKFALRVPVIAASALLLSGQLQAQTVAWGSSVNFTPISFTQNGEVDNEVLTWDLGYFSTGYTPDQTNYATWAANWNPVATDKYKDFGGLWALSVNTLDVGAAAAGRQMYIFAYNSLANIGTNLGEALLFREDGLLFPTVPNQVTFDIANNPLDTNDDAFTVIWGQVDRSVYGAGGMVVGGGTYLSLGTDSNTQPPNNGLGTFEAQSFTWGIPIPEPSAAVFACLGSLILLRRRR
jgi:hypothetical protein